ncbi:DNA-binding protein [Bifidobacterium aemilianum]|uniref:DNA-binding protein n=1 Tax=Bifidobacterium aemilianum TaxID=2493120 RepID=A0A366K845_9BIFI|nr:DUF177 domain-containing protein [Bifidobacterium aemilianum]RBP97422.1 DNA-binding protein [Bifidobacterium aemilianum]
MPRPEDSAWAIPVAQVSSRPGQSKAVDMVFPAPSGIGDKIVGIQEGADVRLVGSIDSIVDGLLLTGHITAPLHAECTRCLKPINRDWKVDVTVFFPYEAEQPKDSSHSRSQGGGRASKEEEIDIIAGEEEGGDSYPLSQDGGFADVEALLRDNLVESLPLKLLCKPDCQGLCPQCGINLNENPGHQHEVIDNRFSQLEALKAELEAEEATGHSGN